MKTTAAAAPSFAARAHGEVFGGEALGGMLFDIEVCVLLFEIENFV
jgi:hypothetical protein